MDEESVQFIHTTNIQEKKLFSQKLALVIIPTSNNSQTNVRNVVKIRFYAISELSSPISLKNLRVYIEKIKVR